MEGGQGPGKNRVSQACAHEQRGPSGDYHNHRPSNLTSGHPSPGELKGARRHHPVHAAAALAAEMWMQRGVQDEHQVTELVPPPGEALSLRGLAPPAPRGTLRLSELSQSRRDGPARGSEPLGHSLQVVPRGRCGDGSAPVNVPLGWVRRHTLHSTPSARAAPDTADPGPTAMPSMSFRLRASGRCDRKMGGAFSWSRVSGGGRWPGQRCDQRPPGRTPFCDGGDALGVVLRPGGFRVTGMGTSTASSHVPSQAGPLQHRRGAAPVPGLTCGLGCRAVRASRVSPSCVPHPNLPSPRLALRGRTWKHVGAGVGQQGHPGGVLLTGEDKSHVAHPPRVRWHHVTRSGARRPGLTALLPRTGGQAGR